MYIILIHYKASLEIYKQSTEIHLSKAVGFDGITPLYTSRELI